jgi:hypothetical protein
VTGGPIRGMAARHMIVRDACRDTHGDDGAITEALAAIEKEARTIIGAWPKGQGTQFHFVLMVEPAPRLKCSACGFFVHAKDVERCNMFGEFRDPDKCDAYYPKG